MNSTLEDRMALMVAISSHTGLHISPPGVEEKVFFAIFTLIWLIQVVRFRSFWNYVPPAELSGIVAPGATISVQLTFKRQAPIAFVTAAFMIGVGWLIILFTNDVWVIAPVLLLSALSIVGLVLVASVWLWNRPRRLVPPGLRDFPGILSRP